MVYSKTYGNSKKRTLLIRGHFYFPRSFPSQTLIKIFQKADTLLADSLISEKTFSHEMVKTPISALKLADIEYQTVQHAHPYTIVGSVLEIRSSQSTST